MTDWLSSTWEANWRSFRYFIWYRLVLAIVSGVAIALPHGWIDPFHLAQTPGLRWLGAAYLLFLAAGEVCAIRWQEHFNLQLSLQVLADVLFVAALMHGAGGVTSGLGVLLLVSLASASLVGRGRLVLFYAALATLAVLGQQIYGVLKELFDLGSIVQAGFLSAGFFATAILARLLGQRVMFNEDLARRRGLALENQQRISQRVFERMQDGVLVVDSQGAVAHFNPEACGMLGPALTVGCILSACNAGLASALQAWRQKDGAYSVEIDGHEACRLRARFEPTESTSGEALVFLEDIGRIEERAQQLKLASLGRLTANIAHEIRNPLSSIGHAGELLREERCGEVQDRLLRILSDNVARLDRIVQDVLEIGRRSTAQPEMIDLASYVRHFIDDFSAGSSVAEGVIRVDVPEGLSLHFDRAHLHQILWNLMSNALRHSRKETGSLLLRALPVGRRVELHIEDDGPGVPEALRRQIFEPFFTTHTQGTGLGLFIARELCEGNAATLELGPPGEGGHFVLQGKTEA